MDVITFNEGYSWLRELKNKMGAPIVPRLLLGNGFSIAFDRDRFSYRMLRAEAEGRKLIGGTALRLFERLETEDFEIVIKALDDAALALEIIDSAKFQAEISEFRGEAARLKEALARVLAGLHPERPNEISDDAYIRVRDFLDHFEDIYTANYDLLLYWALMQGIDGMKPRWSDDGFRDPGYPAPYVLWDRLKPFGQTVHYLHGALHLFRGDDGLRKLTWLRTDDPLIDQIRAQLDADSYPLYVAEGTSAAKLRRIGTSDYLAKALRSLAGKGGGLLVYGLSFGRNDEHIADAVARSNVDRLAVSLFGSPDSEANQKTMAAVADLQVRRVADNSRRPLDVRFFDAGSIQLWK